MGDRDEGGLTIDGSNDRVAYAFHKDALGMGVSMNQKTEINYIPDRTSFLISSMFGAGRLPSTMARLAALSKLPAGSPKHGFRKIRMGRAGWSVFGWIPARLVRLHVHRCPHGHRCDGLLQRFVRHAQRRRHDYGARFHGRHPHNHHAHRRKNASGVVDVSNGTVIGVVPTPTKRIAGASGLPAS